MQESEAAAVARAQSGDGEAFRLLVERHGRSVYRLAYRLTGQPEDAEDIVQETFLRAFRQLDHYDGRASFHTWIYRIAANLAIDLLRTRRQRPRGDAESLIDDTAAVDPGADRLVYSAQMRQRLAAAMSELTGQEKTAFVLRHFEGMSIEEIGETLGTGPSATKNSIFRAVQKVRRALEPFVEAVR